MFAYDYRRGGVLRSLKVWSWPEGLFNRTERPQPYRETFGRVIPALLGGGRVTELVRFRNCVIIFWQVETCLADQCEQMPRKTQKQDCCCSDARFTSSSNFYQFLVYFLPQDVTSNSMF